MAGILQEESNEDFLKELSCTLCEVPVEAAYDILHTVKFERVDGPASDWHHDTF